MGIEWQIMKVLKMDCAGWMNAKYMEKEYDNTPLARSSFLVAHGGMDARGALDVLWGGNEFLQPFRSL